MPQKKKPTIYDVAEKSGISISTISRVLNNPDKVNPETRVRVINAIDKLGFVPKAEARARALSRANRVGVITPFFTAPSFVQRLRGVASVLSKTKYELVIYTVDSMDHLRGFLATLPLTGNLDGLIIMSLPIEDEEARRFADNGLETVLIEYPHPNLNSIEIDDFQGGRMAAEHLIQKGHQRIAFLGDIEPREDFVIHPVSKRLLGFRQALQEASIPLPDSYISSAPILQENSRKAAKQLLNVSERPTAVFAAADIQAMSVIRVARQMNLNIPGDLAVIGFDDIDLADYIDLTTINQHLDESGKIAAEILLSRISNPNRPLQHTHLTLDLIERLST